MTRLRTPPANIRGQIDELAARAEALEQQLVQSQRLATLGTLSMSVAHEFNNLLMTIINQADSALAVGDTGCGIQPEYMAQLFDPFFTTKKAGQDGSDDDAGTGLGLWLAQKVVEAHGGDIRAVSQPGDGATFTIYLPEAKN